MKLALVTETFPPEVNGVAMTFGVITRELAQRGHVVTVYRPRRRDLPRESRSAEFEEVLLPGMPVPGYPQLRLGLPARRFLQLQWMQARPDLVHVVTEGPLGASAVSAARALGVPVTSSFHTNFHLYARSYGMTLLRRPALAWLRRLHNRTQRTFVPTSELAEQLRCYGFRDLAILSRGVDTWGFHPARRSPELRARWGAVGDMPVVIHIGRMAREKNYGLLFRAYAAMKAANPRLRFVLAGEGPLQSRLQSEHPECTFAGFLSRQEVGRYYASADIYVHASDTETFGNVVAEALSSGLAVTGYDYAAARQFITHGRNGLLASYGQPEALIDAAVLLATDELLRAQLRRAARSAIEHQSWSAVVERFEADLLSVTGAVRPRQETVAA